MFVWKQANNPVSSSFALLVQKMKTMSPFGRVCWPPWIFCAVTSRLRLFKEKKQHCYAYSLQNISVILPIKRGRVLQRSIFLSLIIEHHLSSDIKPHTHTHSSSIFSLLTSAKKKRISSLLLKHDRPFYIFVSCRLFVLFYVPLNHSCWMCKTPSDSQSRS